MKRRSFLRTTLAGTVAAGSGLTFFSGCRGGSSDDERLRRQVTAAFRRFSEVWDFNDFWKRGNTMDACLTFAGAARTRWPGDAEIRKMQEKVTAMLRDDLAFFRRFDLSGLWADDFGWWGLMALNARRHLLHEGEETLAEEYLHLAGLCWEHKVKYAYDATPDARPVPHGCRNGDAAGHDKGVKNTVTNVLLLLLSSRLYRTSLETPLEGADRYLDMTWRQWRWFEQWFALEEYAYLKRFAGGAGLVQERPMAFFEGSDYQDRGHPPWEEGWTWSGDQGMLVAALTDLLLLRKPLQRLVQERYPDETFVADTFSHDVEGYLRTLGRGIRQALVARADGLLREAPFTASFGPRHGNDYVAGRGILMRYLGDPQVRARVPHEMKEVLHRTARAIWTTRDTRNDQFTAEYTSPENDRLYIQQFRDLWGKADEVYRWELKHMDEQQKLGVCQAIGLDAFGAVMRT